MTGSGSGISPRGLRATARLQPCSSFGHKLMGQAAPLPLPNHHPKAGVWIPFR